MHATPSFRLFSARALACALPLFLLLGSPSQAQTAASPSTPQPSPAPAVVKEPTEQTTQHIVVEDTATRIDEVRIGSETKSIDVQPKNGMPAYQVEPKSGERTWKVLGF
ncbi:hypothetical protein [Rhodoferax sp. U11-2br]|uniref:hypothetical protein n=1 Tax=Rhodoferax sp. U11-2br TaxID=2838878 RepID=UPI001BE66708|nr:hypothetical protein [Rhodoferax sp. U11-2br]MBT3068885.1 hypothetical protein [Rhodoferax sp. U11-2br]